MDTGLFREFILLESALSVFIFQELFIFLLLFVDFCTDVTSLVPDVGGCVFYLSLVIKLGLYIYYLHKEPVFGFIDFLYFCFPFIWFLFWT